MTKLSSASALRLAACGLALVCASWHAAAAYPIAGLAPDARPAGAPRIIARPMTLEATGAALRGVTLPIPGGLHFLRHQGAWYTPFSEPGMTARYDLRGWHAAPADPRFQRIRLPQGK